MDEPGKVLVTGAGGYIGSVLSAKLLNRGWQLTGLDSASLDELGLGESPGFSSIRGSITDEDVIARALEGADSIIHLAAVSDGAEGRLNPERTREVNYDAFAKLLHRAKSAGVRRFVFVSTVSVYGYSYTEAVHEDMPVNPVEEYSVTKAGAEIIAREANSASFTTVCIRPSVVCGWSPRIKFNFIVNALAKKAILDGRLSIMGGNQIRPQIHIEDLTDYLAESLSLPAALLGGEVFNASGQNISVREIAEDVREVLDGRLEIELLPARENEYSYAIDAGKISQVLGLSPRRTVKDAVASIYEAYKQGLWT